MNPKLRNWLIGAAFSIFATVAGGVITYEFTAYEALKTQVQWNTDQVHVMKQQIDDHEQEDKDLRQMFARRHR